MTTLQALEAEKAWVYAFENSQSPSLSPDPKPVAKSELEMPTMSAQTLLQLEGTRLAATYIYKVD
jgi:hypothetical protein